MAYQKTLDDCKSILCKNEIHDASEFKRKARDLSRKLQQDLGLSAADAQNHPLYKELLQCSPNSFDERIVQSPAECLRQKSSSSSLKFSKSSYSNPSLSSSYKKKKKFGPKNRNCPKGTRRNKKTGRCEKPGPKRPKCPKGSRKNRKTGKCQTY
jgi:hypothetical protein